MKNVIREVPGLLTPINGVEFHQLGELSISALVSEQDAENFCAVPGFRLADDSEVPEALRPKAQQAAPAPVKENKTQKAAREAAEQAEAQRLADEKAEADRLAAEKAEADRLAAANDVPPPSDVPPAPPAGGTDDSEVF